MNFQMNDIAIYECLANAMNFMQPGVYLHQLRVAIVADRIAEEINLSKPRREVLLYASLVHDFGSLYVEDDKTHNGDGAKGAYQHARAGYEVLKNYNFFEHVGSIILHHHDWWDGSHPKSGGREIQIIPIESRIINVAEEVTIYLDDTSGKKPLATIHEYLKTMGMHKLDPDLLEAFAKTSFLNRFWKDYTWPNLRQYFKKYFGDSYLRNISLEAVRGFSEILFSLLAKWSVSTARHAKLVATMAKYIAELRNFSAEQIDCVYIAGLLHDIGKLAIPQKLLDKPGELSGEEYKLVQKHAYYTHWLLSQVNGLGEISKWAAYHHETLDGKGYPFGLKKYKLSEEARIIAVADIFAALTEERSYHSALDLEKVKAVMYSAVKSKKIDGDIVKTVFTNIASDYLEIIN